jgi:hypothetical protein
MNPSIRKAALLGGHTLRLADHRQATDHLGFWRAHFEMRKTNERVRKVHHRLGATRQAQTEQDGYMSIARSRARYRRYFTGAVTCVFAASSKLR